jgi:hypothetical protein
VRIFRTLSSFIACAALLGGCSALRPQFPLDLNSNASDQSIDATKNVLSESQKRIAQAALDKNGQDWTQKEIMLLSSILAVGGHAADKTGLFNTGLGAGIVSLAVNTFYDPQKTTEIHLNALSEFQCLSRVSAPVSDAEWGSALNATDKETRSQVLNAPKYLREAVDEARLRYARALLAQERKSYSSSDIFRFLDDHRRERDEQTNAQNSALQAKEELDNLEINEISYHNGGEISDNTQQALTKTGGVTVKNILTSTSALDQAQKAVMSAAFNMLKQQHKGTISAAKFVGLKTELEACFKGLQP